LGPSFCSSSFPSFLPGPGCRPAVHRPAAPRQAGRLQACLFKATARLYDKGRKVLVEHTGLGSTVILASEAAIKKLLDEVSPGRLRLIEWSTIETVVARVEE
jgi:hypothetical protein